MPSTPFFLDDVGELIQTYDLFLMDMWGVTHNGLEPFEGALHFFNAVYAAGKQMVFLSNAPRMPEASAARLIEMGIKPEWFSAIITSGGECYQYLMERQNPFYQNLGECFYYYGPEREKSLATSVGERYKWVSTLDQANFILMTSTLNWDDTLETVRPFLTQALELNLPIVCANADNTVIRGNERLLCAGAIAREYARMGGNVSIHGKPSTSVYELAHQHSPNTPKDKILMVGDSLETDIKGANNYGVDSLMVLTGVHGDDFAGLMLNSDESLVKFQELRQQFQSIPTYWASGLN